VKKVKRQKTEHVEEHVELRLLKGDVCQKVWSSSKEYGR
jgi:hypothetical protein